ncbi:MAG TPA: hypothetical protein VE010_22485 [Thermoanaerobaculia bacterium]|nr:hypothetical protein [Thermoanaerobaculia bacterium]
MTTMKRFFLTITLAATMALPAFAYEVDTHRQMTLVATPKTVLFTDPWLMFHLGLLPASQQEFAYYLRTGIVRTGTGIYRVHELLAEGSVDEDDTPRFMSHFYDPVNDVPLSRAGIHVGHRSWEWAVEETPIGGIFSADQDHSLRDARDFLTRSLTYRDGTPAEAEQERGIAISQMLISLGHVMHHMQDMAQPQHVRNDQHFPYGWGSRYEYYTNQRRGGLVPLMQLGSPVGGTDYKRARDFWFNDAQSGIAQRTNRDFLSHGTNFMMTRNGATAGDYAHPQPQGSTDYTPEQAWALTGDTVPGGSETLCGRPAVNCTMTMYATPMTTRASTYSVFNQDLDATGVQVTYDRATGQRLVVNRLFALNRFNFEAVYGELMPRAVSYSAGIVNHFLRGRLEVTPPTVGAYSVVDHSTGEGFRKIRTTVKNVTPGEALPGGTIRLIARYRRNLCYQPDLSGEFQLNAAGQSAPPCPNYLSPNSYVAVSLEQNANFADGESKQLTFTMVDAIPLDATDLILQVYYTGTVGVEADSFAIGAVDVSEPTYMTAMNGTDTFLLNGVFYYWRDIVENIGSAPYSAIDINRNGRYDPPNDVNVTGGNMSFEIYINGMKVADAPAVPEGRFTRLAMLVDMPTGFEHRIIARGSQFARSDTYRFPGKYLQGNVGTAVGLLRNHTLQLNSTTLNAYHPTPNGSVATMPKSLMPDATLPVPLQLTPGVLLSTTAPVSTEWTSSMSVFSAIRSKSLSSMLPDRGPELQPQPLAGQQSLQSDSTAARTGTATVVAIPARSEQ